MPETMTAMLDEFLSKLIEFASVLVGVQYAIQFIREYPDQGNIMWNPETNRAEIHAPDAKHAAQVFVDKFMTKVTSDFGFIFVQYIERNTFSFFKRAYRDTETVNAIAELLPDLDKVEVSL